MQSLQFELHANMEQRHWWFVARRQVMRAVVERLVPPQAGGDSSRRATVIDVGCGTGANIAALADGYHAVGIDTSPDAIRFAAQRFPDVDFRAGYAPGDLGDCLPQAKLVMMMDVLEHVPDDFQLLSGIMSAASEGTYFLLTVPADLALWSPHDETFGHYRRYDAARFRQLWADLPVEECLLTPFNTRLYPLIRLIRGWNRRRQQSTGEVGTDFDIPSTWKNQILRSVFAGERKRILRTLDGSSAATRMRGVSLMAVLRRGAGVIDVQTKPEAATDFFDPVAGEYLSTDPACVLA